MNFLGISARFAIWCISLFTLITWLPESLFSILNRHTAYTSAGILRILGFHPVLDSTILRQGNLSVEVITECSAIYLWILFFSFVVSYPAPFQRKIPELLTWITLLHLANIFRIALIFAVGVKIPTLFELTHVYLGQVLMVLLIIAVCLSWVRSTDSESSNRSVASFAARCIAWSSLPFILWVLYNREYVMITDQIVRWFFKLSGNTLEIPYSHTLYFQTFNLVAITGILLAGRENITKKRVPMLLAIVTTVVSLHVLIRICNVLVTAFGSSFAIAVSTAATVVGQYLIPVICWILLMRTEPPWGENLDRKRVETLDGKICRTVPQIQHR